MIKENSVYSSIIVPILFVFFGLILFFIPDYFIIKNDVDTFIILVKERALFCFTIAIIIWKIAEFSIIIYLKLADILSLILIFFLIFDPIHSSFLFLHQSITYIIIQLLILIMIQYDKFTYEID
jgi:hypothetical protein